MKKLCVSLMTLVSLLCVSCSNDPEIPVKEDNGIDVTLSITTNPLTKALDDNQVTKTAPIDPSKEFIVYFMDETTDPKVVASYKLTNDQITAIQTAGTGVKFTNLDPSVKSVYVVANVPTSITAPGTLPSTAPGTILTAINGAIMNISDQQANNAASVVLANTSKTVVSIGSSTGTASNGNAKYNASIELTPIVSRIQIASITNDASITSFKLAGIYIDNFYQNMSLGGVLSNIIKAAAGEVAKFNLSTTLASTPYKTNGQLFDEASNLEQNPGGMTPAQVYGYQFFPTKGTDASDLSNVPYIILKLTNVVGTTRTFPNTAYYIAVKAYKTTDATPATITEFLPGQIYTIANIPVSEKNIVTDPTQSLINVTVNVTVAKWTDKALNPDFGY